MLETHLGNYEGEVERELQDIASRRIIPRIWARDHTVWRDDPSEVSNRLGWMEKRVAVGGKCMPWQCHIPQLIRQSRPYLSNARCVI